MHVPKGSSSRQPVKTVFLGMCVANTWYTYKSSFQPLISICVSDCVQSLKKKHVLGGFSPLFRQQRILIWREKCLTLENQSASLVQLWQRPFCIFQLTCFKTSYTMRIILFSEKNSLNLLNFLGKFFTCITFFLKKSKSPRLYLFATVRLSFRHLDNYPTQTIFP